VRACVRLCIRTYVRTYVSRYVHTYKCTYLCTYVSMHIRTYIQTYICTDVRTYMRTYIHTYNTILYTEQWRDSVVIIYLNTTILYIYIPTCSGTALCMICIRVSMLWRTNDLRRRTSSRLSSMEPRWVAGLSRTLNITSTVAGQTALRALVWNKHHINTTYRSPTLNLTRANPVFNIVSGYSKTTRTIGCYQIVKGHSSTETSGCYQIVTVNRSTRTIVCYWIVTGDNRMLQDTHR